MIETTSTTNEVAKAAPAPVTVKIAVSAAAKTQRHTLVVAVLIVLAYVAGMYSSRFTTVLHDPPSKEQMLQE